MAQVTVSKPARAPLPRPIRRALGRLDRRLRALAVVRGLGTAALVAALGAAAGMAVDLGWRLSPAARWGVWGAWVGAAAAPLLAALGRGLTRRARSLELAAVLERSDPTLGGRLTGAVDLLGGPAHGSPALIAALADEAAGRVGAVDAGRAAPAGRAWRRFAAGAAALAVVAAPAVVRDDLYGRLARRFLMPWVEAERVGLEVVSVAPGDAVVALGDGLAVSARVAPRFGRAPAATGATLEWRDAATGRTRRVAMADAEGAARAAGGRAFSASLPGLTGSLTYRVVGRSGESRRYRVTVVPPPAVASIAARVEPPAYTKLPAADARNPARIEAWEDSRVHLTVATTTPVTAAEIAWPAKALKEGAKPEPRRVAATISADGRTATADVSADVSGGYSVSLRDAHGLTGRPEPSRRVVVRPDAPPVVSVRGADGPVEAKADDTVRVEVAARDDLAVASVEVHYAVERAGSAGDAGEPEVGHAAGKPAGLGTPSARGELALALAPLGLRAGDVVSYRVRVGDNRPAPRGPNFTWSAPGRVTVVARAEPLAVRRNRAGREALQKTLDGLKAAAAENRRQTEALRYAADAVQRGNGRWDDDRRQALSEREAAARGLVGKLEGFARDLADDPAFRPLARAARQTADVEAEAARETLDRARQAGDPAARLAELRQADARLGAVGRRLDELQNGLNAQAEREADRRRLQGLAERQARVAEKAAAARGDGQALPDRVRLDQVAAEQNAVKGELDALLKKSPEMRAEVLAAQADEADALARRAREVARRQREEARRATDLSRRGDTLKALADDQRALEGDARRLAMDVDQPLAENGRGPLNAAPIGQAADPIERGDLAQGRQQLETAENELRRLARDLEDAPVDLKAMARRLAHRQEKITNDLAAALGEARNKDKLPADDRKALAETLRPLAGRQKAVAALAAALLDAKEAKNDKAEPRFPRDAANQAAATTKRAAGALDAPDNPREAERRAVEARDALHRLTNDLPDPWRREEPVRRAVAEAKRTADEVANQVDRHLRETDRPHERDFTPARGAAELAQRLGPLADQARQAAKRLGEVEPAPRVRPQAERAARRARALADAVEAARKQAPQNPNAPAGFDADQARALRDALAAAALDTRHAFERVEQKLNNAVPADDLADDLAVEQRALAGGATPKNAEGDPPAPRAADQRRVATALRNLRAPDAPLELAEAVRTSDRAARALEARGGEKGADEEVRHAAEAAGALADRLSARETPRDRARALARAERGLNDPDGPPDPAAEVARQRAVAAGLVRLSGAAAGKDGPAVEAVHAAAGLAARALRPEEAVPGQGPPTARELSDAHARAADAIDALAARLPGGRADAPRDPNPGANAPRDPELAIDAGHAARARELARRERRVRERLQAVLGERVGPQQELKRDAVAVGRALADLRDRSAPVSDRSRGPAGQAASLLGEQAPQAMEEATGQLARAEPAPARDAQRRAAESAERGAQSADDLAEALRAESPRARARATADAGADRPDPASLAGAREAMGQAAQSLGRAREPGHGGGEAVDAARRSMRAAADRLQAAAEKARGGGEPGDGEDGGESVAGSDPPTAAGQPGAAAGDPKGGQAGTADPATLRDIQEIVRSKTGRRWGELPGHLRTEILQMSQGRYRDEYARLIQLYFREIAAGADARP